MAKNTMKKSILNIDCVSKLDKKSKKKFKAKTKSSEISVVPAVHMKVSLKKKKINKFKTKSSDVSVVPEASVAPEVHVKSALRKRSKTSKPKQVVKLIEEKDNVEIQETTTEKKSQKQAEFHEMGIDDRILQVSVYCLCVLFIDEILLY